MKPFLSVELLSRVWLFATPWTAARQASLSNTNSRSLLKLMSIELVMPSNHLILCCPLLLPPSIFPSIRVFFHESVLCTRWPKYWSFTFIISPSNEYSGLISFRMDWLDLLAAQGTLKSLLQHHSSKASILQCLAFFVVQLSHPLDAPNYSFKWFEVIGEMQREKKEGHLQCPEGNPLDCWVQSSLGVGVSAFRPERKEHSSHRINPDRSLLKNLESSTKSTNTK